MYRYPEFFGEKDNEDDNNDDGGAVQVEGLGFRF
jgi:hypothetical protein